MKNILNITLLSTVAMTAGAHASVIFSEDFESGTAGNSLSGNGWTLVGNDADRTATYTTDSGTIFSSSNQYLNFVDNSATGSFRIRQSDLTDATSIAKLSFDFHDPSFGGNNITFMHIGTGLLSNNDDRLAQLAWNPASGGAGNGSFGTGSRTGVYALDATHSVTIYLNNSSSAVAYEENGSQSVGAQRYDIWLNGVLVGDDAFFNNANIAADATLGSFELVSFSTATQDILIDNIVFENSFTAIPEPSTFSLAAAASLAALFIIRRRRS